MVNCYQTCMACYFTDDSNTVKFRKKAPGLTFFKGPFWGAYIRRGLSLEENLHFKIDWASLIVGRKLTFFLCLTLYLRTIFEIQVAGGACSLIVFYNCKSVIKLNPGFYLSENELYWIVCGRWKTLMIITFLILPKQKFTGATGRAFLFKKVWVFFIINLPRPRPPLTGDVSLGRCLNFGLKISSFLFS